MRSAPCVAEIYRKKVAPFRHSTASWPNASHPLQFPTTTSHVTGYSRRRGPTPWKSSRRAANVKLPLADTQRTSPVCWTMRAAARSTRIRTAVLRPRQSTWATYVLAKADRAPELERFFPAKASPASSASIGDADEVSFGDHRARAGGDGCVSSVAWNSTASGTGASAARKSPASKSAPADVTPACFTRPSSILSTASATSGAVIA